MIRSLFAFAAAAWFGFNALWYVVPGVYADGDTNVLDGEPAALAVTYAARMLCFGLALASLALIDWHWFGTVPNGLSAPPSHEDVRE